MRKDKTIWSHLSGKTTFRATDKPLHVQRKVLQSYFYPHDHDFIEAALVTEGTGLHCTRDGERVLYPGDLILIAPGVWHSFRVPDRLVVYNCCFGISMLTNELTTVFHNSNLRRLFSVGDRSLDTRSIIISRIEKPAIKRCVRSLIRMENLLDTGLYAERYLELIAHLMLYLNEISPYLDEPEAPAEKTPVTAHPAVLRCRALLTEQYDQDWTLTRLAEEIHIAPKYLVRIFHESTGISPMAYLTRIRAERASLLLVDTTLPIAEIGRIVGWPDPNYFARRFRNRFEMSATEYRNRFTRQHGLIATE